MKSIRIGILTRPFMLTVCVSVIAAAVFSWWYSSGDEPLTEEEVAAFSARIAQLPESSRSFLAGAGIDAFMREDDGKAFHVVNLFRLADEPDRTNVVSREKLAEFSTAVLPLWLKYGGYPVFAMEIPRRSGVDAWDLVSVVRYRSRRDFIELVLGDAYQRALPKRLAATQVNLRFTGGGNEFPKPFALLLLLTLATLVLVYVIEARRFQIAAAGRVV